MAKSLVKKSVIARAEVIVATSPKPQPTQPRPLAMVTLRYPRHGTGTLTDRTVRVLECQGDYIRGYEVRGLDDKGEYKVFLRNKIVGPVTLLLLEPVTE